jgi:hypothetical protein
MMHDQIEKLSLLLGLEIEAATNLLSAIKDLRGQVASNRLGQDGQAFPFPDALVEQLQTLTAERVKLSETLTQTRPAAILEQQAVLASLARNLRDENLALGNQLQRRNLLVQRMLGSLSVQTNTYESSGLHSAAPVRRSRLTV